MSTGATIGKRSSRRGAADQAATWAVALLVIWAAQAGAQDASPSAGAPATTSTRISFLPPPLEGTISLGIYDSSGKLVRVLHREAQLEQFEIGSDALVTTWNGRDDRGEQLPPGRYHARGYAVGDVQVDGVGFYFNDWVTDQDSPRIRRVTRLWFRDGKLVLEADVLDAKADGRGVRFTCDEGGNITDPYSGSIPAHAADGEHPGKDGTTWVIDHSGSGAQPEVKQFSPAKELLRRLAIGPLDPQPTAIAASDAIERVYLLEENDALQRVRALALLATGEAVSDWKVAFEKQIVKHNDFAIANGKPVVTGGTRPSERMTVKLAPNPLKNDARETLELVTAFDSDGSYLTTADGLPLTSISETPQLARVVLAPNGEKSTDVFQDNEAVVEQFRITGLDQMMAFDCGDFELK